ncbi:hypothetical protein Salat_2431100 [Sesamum alatum]|uniref:Uncharacterized protein n=1 Tax=Sesamum alatum TaxID=300844 RepID=A0AAE2CFH2_9LAMI|nr:hypothetical protein Salat_2431100 [Sesamum alatum]
MRAASTQLLGSCCQATAPGVVQLHERPARAIDFLFKELEHIYHENFADHEMKKVFRSNTTMWVHRQFTETRKKNRRPNWMTKEIWEISSWGDFLSSGPLAQVLKGDRADAVRPSNNINQPSDTSGSNSQSSKGLFEFGRLIWVLQKWRSV